MLNSAATNLKLVLSTSVHQLICYKSIYRRESPYKIQTRNSHYRISYLPAKNQSLFTLIPVTLETLIVSKFLKSY